MYVDAAAGLLSLIVEQYIASAIIPMPQYTMLHVYSEYAILHCVMVENATSWS